MVATTDLPLKPALDDVLGNFGGDTGRMSINDLVTLFLSKATLSLSAGVVSYASAAQGLAATAEGAFFAVIPGSGDPTAATILYKKVGGAAVEQNRISSAAQVDSLRGETINRTTNMTGVNAYVVTTYFPVTAYFEGMRVHITMVATNTGPATLKIGSLAAIPLLDPTGYALKPGQLEQFASYVFFYTSGNFRMVSGRAGGPVKQPIYGIATLPEAAAFQDHTAILTDSGDRVLMQSNGKVWLPCAPLSGPGNTPTWLPDPTATLAMDFRLKRYWGLRGWFNQSLVAVTRADSVYSYDLAGAVSGPFTANQMRQTTRGMGIWYKRLNQFLNSTAPQNQTITVVVARDYYVEMWGSGSITLSGGATGTITQGAGLKINPTTTSVTVTVSGTVSFVNFCPFAVFSSPPIVTTGVVNPFDDEIVYLDLANLPWWTGAIPNVFTILAVFETQNNLYNGTPWQLDDGTQNNRLVMNWKTSNMQSGVTVTVGGVDIAGVDPAIPPVVVPNRSMVFGFTVNMTTRSMSVCLGDNVAGFSAVNTWAPMSVPAGLRYLRLGAQKDGLVPLNGFLKKLAIIPDNDVGSLQARTAAFIAGVA